MRRSSPGVGRRKEKRRNVQNGLPDVLASEARRRQATAQSTSLASVLIKESWETER